MVVFWVIMSKYRAIGDEEIKNIGYFEKMLFIRISALWSDFSKYPVESGFR